MANQPYPVVQIDADNVAAVSWTKKAATASIQSKALTRLFAALTLNNPLGIYAKYLEGHKNILPDLLSRINSTPTATTLPQIQAKFPWMITCPRFLPSHELLSRISSALLHGQVPDLAKIDSYGHFSPAKITG